MFHVASFPVASQVVRFVKGHPVFPKILLGYFTILLKLQSALPDLREMLGV